MELLRGQRPQTSTIRANPNPAATPDKPVSPPDTTITTTNTSFKLRRVDKVILKYERGTQNTNFN